MTSALSSHPKGTWFQPSFSYAGNGNLSALKRPDREDDHSPRITVKAKKLFSEDERRGPVVNTPASYSGGAVLKSQNNMVKISFVIIVGKQIEHDANSRTFIIAKSTRKSFIHHHIPNVSCSPPTFYTMERVTQFMCI
jgi:hypothetical protein